MKDEKSILFVKNFPESYEQSDLGKLFSTYGTIKNLFVNPSFSYGFVYFDSEEAANKAKEALNDSEIEGKKLIVVTAMSQKEVKANRLELYKDRNLYVKDFPPETTDESLKEAFSQFGEVTSARVMIEVQQDYATKERKAISKGFGFVCFATKEEAKKALEEVPKTTVLGTTLYVNMA